VALHSPLPPTTSARWRGLALAAGIAAAALAAYLPVFRAGFVFDDHHLIEAGEAPIQGSLGEAWKSVEAPDYLPVTWTVLWFEWRLFGPSPLGYHALDLGFHIGVALLLWRLLFALGLPGSWLAGLLFAVHPVTVESAAWVSEHKNTVSGVLFMGAALSAVRSDQGGGRRASAAALGLHTLAVLAKASTVMLPVALLAVPLLRRRRLTRADLTRLGPLFAVSLAGGMVALWFQLHHAMAGMAVAPRGAAERLGGAGWAEAAYLLDAFLPVRLALLAAPWPLDASSPLFYVPLLALLVLAGGLVSRRAGLGWPVLLALGVHLALTLPVLGLVDIAWLAFAPVSNHLQYLALAGPVALVAAAIARLRRPMAAAGWVAGLAAALALGATTFGRAAAFENDLTLWTAAVRDAPASPVARYELALQLLAAGRSREAIQQLVEMAEVARQPHLRHRARALAALFSGRAAEATEEALRADEVLPDAGFDQAVVGELVRLGATGEAARLLRAGRAPRP
jgi:protein O-mannosyl-transferase